MAGLASGTEAVNVHLDTAANGARKVCHSYTVHLSFIIFVN